MADEEYKNSKIVTENPKNQILNQFTQLKSDGDEIKRKRNISNKRKTRAYWA